MDVFCCAKDNPPRAVKYKDKHGPKYSGPCGKTPKRAMEVGGGIPWPADLQSSRLLCNCTEQLGYKSLGGGNASPHADGSRVDVMM